MDGVLIGVRRTEREEEEDKNLSVGFILKPLFHVQVHVSTGITSSQSKDTVVYVKV